ARRRALRGHRPAVVMVAARAGSVRRTGPTLTWRHGHYARRAVASQARRRHRLSKWCAQAGSGTMVLSPGGALTHRHPGRSHGHRWRVATPRTARRLLLPAVAAATAALTLGAGNSPFAVAGWTVSPGGSFTGHAGTTELADTTTGQAA